MPAQQARNSTATTRFRYVGVWFFGRTPSKPVQPLTYAATLYSESGSIGRSVFSRKNSHQPRLAESANGAFTSAHTPTVVAAVRQNGWSLPARRHSTNSTPNRNSGYS